MRGCSQTGDLALLQLAKCKELVRWHFLQLGGHYPITGKQLDAHHRHLLEFYRFAYSAFAGGAGKEVLGGLLDKITKIGE